MRDSINAASLILGILFATLVVLIVPFSYAAAVTFYVVEMIFIIVFLVTDRDGS